MNQQYLYQRGFGQTENLMMYHIIDETLPGWRRLQAQQGGQPAVFLYNDAVHVQQPSNVSALRGDGNRQCGQENSGGHPEDRTKVSLTNLSLLERNVCTAVPIMNTIPLHLILGQILAHLP